MNRMMPPSGPTTPCRYCKGNGVVKLLVKGQPQERKCPECGGTGKSSAVLTK